MKRSVLSKLVSWILIFVMMTIYFIPTNIAFAKENQVNENKTSNYIVVMKDNKAKDKIVAGIKNKYKIKKKDLGTLPAVSVEMTQAEVNDLMSDELVDYIEPDSEVVISGEDFIPWNLEDVGVKPVHKKDLNGEGIKIAVLDTGVAEHPDITIAGKQSFLADSSTVDENGHGT